MLEKFFAQPKITKQNLTNSLTILTFGSIMSEKSENGVCDLCSLKG